MMDFKELLRQAQSTGFALGAFNVCNLETLKAIIGAAEKLQAPLIVESSPGETKFLGTKQLTALIRVYRQETDLPIFLNLDHAKSIEETRGAIEAEFDLIHFDGSALSFEENIRKTKLVVEEAHAKGVLVEGEIDHITGTSEPHLSEQVEWIQQKGKYTDPDRALEFVERTGVDILAVFVGNVHGVYANPPHLDFARLAKIRSKLDCFLSLHGGSGIRGRDIQKAIETGKIVKINVNTELRAAYRQALEQALAETPSVKMYEVMVGMVEAVQEVVEGKIKLFRSDRRLL